MTSYISSGIGSVALAQLGEHYALEVDGSSPLCHIVIRDIDVGAHIEIQSSSPYEPRFA